MTMDGRLHGSNFIPFPGRAIFQLPHHRREGFHLRMARVGHVSLLVGVLVIIPLLIFTHRLHNNPPGFFIDESIYGYEAYLLAHTGGFTSSGEFLPRLYREPGELARNHGLYTYAVIPFITLFGMKEASVRLTSVFMSVTLLSILYGMLRRRTSRAGLLLAALWWPLTAWVFLLSRFGAELMMTAMLCTTLLWLLLSMHDSGRPRMGQILIFDCIAVVLFFTYPAGAVWAVGYVVFASILFWKRKVPLRRAGLLAIAPLVIGLLALPYLLDGSLWFRSNESSLCLQNFPDCALKSFASHFDPRSYFADSYTPSDYPFTRHSILGTSLIPRALAPFLAIGLLVTARRAVSKDILSRLLVVSFLLAILPASMLRRGFDSYRSIGVLPVAFVLIIVGLDVIFRMTKGWSVSGRGLVAALLLIGTVYFGRQELHAFSAYEYSYAAALRAGWQFGYRDVFDYFVAHYDEYDSFVVTKQLGYLPHLYIRFFDPEGRYPKIKAEKKCTAVEGVRTLCAVRTWEAEHDQLQVRATFLFPDGSGISYRAGELSSSAE
jgi:hypothetical protein